MKNKKLKIAIFHLGFFFSGGGEKLVLEEAAGLTKRGHEVSLFAPVVDKEDCFPDLIRKTRVYSLFFPFSFNFPLRDFIAVTGAVFLTPLTFFRYQKYDIFFGANQPGPLICYFLGKILKKPYVIYLAQPTRLLYPRKIDIEEGFGKGSFSMFYFFAHLLRPLIVCLDRISIQGADMILVNGEYMVGKIEKVYKVKGLVCPAGCHPQKKLPNFQKRWRGKLRINHKAISKPYILVTNRHFPQKRFDYAIRVLAKIKKEFPQVSLVITGAPTAYTQELRDLVRKLGLEEKVLFTGLVGESDLLKLYSRAAVYIYTSPEEDFGMGVIESMACGVPVVAWNKAGPSTTIIDSKTGFLVKPYSASEFTKKIIYLLERKGENITMGRKAIAHVRKNYTYTKHNNILEKTLIQVVG
jgi:glycosyltransferase involved in cell wall biosynthesis